MALTIQADTCQAIDGFVFDCGSSVSADCATSTITNPCGSQSTFGTGLLYYSWNNTVLNYDLVNRIDLTVALRTTGGMNVDITAIGNFLGLDPVQLSGGVTLFGVLIPIPPASTTPWFYIIPAQRSTNGSVYGNSFSVWTGAAGSAPALSDLRVQAMTPFSQTAIGEGSAILEVLEVSVTLYFAAVPPTPEPVPVGDCAPIQVFPQAIPAISSPQVQAFPSSLPVSAACSGKNWTTPRITYDDGTGQQNLTFVYQPRKVAAFTYEAVRHDNLSSAGVRETIFERLDKFLDFDMDLVVAGADITGWEQFMSYALQGGAFDFYPDSDGVAFTSCLLEDQAWDSAYRSPGFYSFKVKFRQRVPWPPTTITLPPGGGGGGTTTLSVVGVFPALGAAGTLLTINGTNFVAGSSVAIGTATVFSNFINSTQIQAVAPAQPDGPADVTVNNPDGTTATLVSGFFYNAPGGIIISPLVTSISPSFGSTNGGTTVTITGSGFQLGATVSFG